MGLFDSDYEAHGSVSVNQIGEQRSDADTYYGELLMMHPYNGRNYTDELLLDIKSGVTATYRKYRRRALLDKFETHISITDSGESRELKIVKETCPNASSVSGRWGLVTGMAQALAKASCDPNIKYRLDPSEYYLAQVQIKYGFQTVWYRVTREYIGSNGNLFFDLVNFDGNAPDWPNYDTGIDASKPSIEGYYGVVDEGSKNSLVWILTKYYYFSTDARFNAPIEPKFPLDAYACISLKDNGNNEQPYYTLSKDHYEYKRRERVLDTLGIDFKELSKAIFNPKPIPALGSTEWEKDYGSSYKSSKELQDKYPTEAAYRNDLVESQNQMKEGIKNITDVHFGMFASPKNLSTASAYALKGFFKEILPGLPQPKSIAPMGETEYQGISFDIKSGSLKIRHKISGYKFGRRVGKVSDYKPKDVIMHVKNKGKVSYGVSETYSGTSKNTGVIDGVGLGDQINPWEKLKRDALFEEYDPDFGNGFDSLDYTACGSICIATISADHNGQPTYEFLEIYEPFAVHAIDVMYDGEHGTSQRVRVQGGLSGIKGDEYSDVLLYPITAKSLKVVPIFKRERLIRETSVLIIDGIQVVEIKWYQKGIFKFFFMIVGAVVSCLFAGCVTLGALLAGNAAAWSALALYVFQAVAVGIGISMLLELIDNPLLAALVIIVAGMYGGGGFEGMDYTKMASLAIEATNTYIQKQFAQEMIELEEKAKEMRKKYREASEQMDAVMEEAGMRTDVDSDWILDKASMPPPGEMPKDFFARCLKREFAIIKQDNGNAAVLKTTLPNRKV